MEHDPSQLQSVEEAVERRSDAEVGQSMGRNAVKAATTEPEQIPALDELDDMRQRLHDEAVRIEQRREDEIFHDLMMSLQEIFPPSAEH